MQKLDLTRQRFGRLTVVWDAGSRTYGGTTRGFWVCRCDCGEVLELPTGSLTGGGTKSCGCLVRDAKKRRDATGKWLYGDDLLQEEARIREADDAAAEHFLQSLVREA